MLLVSIYYTIRSCNSIFFHALMGDKNVNLPLGFQFYLTDKELEVHLLYRKTSRLPCYPMIWTSTLLIHGFYMLCLPVGRALAKGNQWYFYSRRTQNRVIANGYWNPMRVKEPVVSSSSNKRVEEEN